MTTAADIRAAASAHGITQAAVAAALGITQSAWSMRKRDRALPPADLERLRAALPDLFDDADDAPPSPERNGETSAVTVTNGHDREAEEDNAGAHAEEPHFDFGDGAAGDALRQFRDSVRAIVSRGADDVPRAERKLRNAVVRAVRSGLVGNRGAELKGILAALLVWAGFPDGAVDADALVDKALEDGAASRANADPFDQEPDLDVDGLPDGFRARPDGIYVEQVFRGIASWSWLCSPIRVTAMSRNADGGAWGKVLHITDPDGLEHVWSMPSGLLAGDGVVPRAECMLMGLRVATGAGPIFAQLLNEWSPAARSRTVDRLGWTSADCTAFVCGDGRVIGEPGHVFQAAHVPGIARAMHQRGTLDDWRSGVAALAPGNILMVVAVSAAFAGPLLEPLDRDGIGLHLRGASSRGKTTLLRASASVWGSPRFVQTWRATSNGLEGVASACNGTLLPLDEMGQVSPHEAGAVAYMTVNGAGKARANAAGTARPAPTWRTVLLSSGELTLADKMLEARQRAKAGQEIRLLDIVADARTHGAFDDISTAGRTFERASQFADHVNAQAAAFYGTAGPRFVEWMTGEGLEHIRKAASEQVDRFRTAADMEVLGIGAVDGQVQRAADRLAVVAAAGELATLAGITGWQPGKARAAVLEVLEDWVAIRGTEGAEYRDAIMRTRDYLATYGDLRFLDLHDHDAARRAASPGGADAGDGPGVHAVGRVSGEVAGWRDPDFFYIHPDAWKRIHAGADPARAVGFLRDAGFLEPGDGRNATYKMPRGVVGRPRAYRIRVDILGEADHFR